MSWKNLDCKKKELLLGIIFIIVIVGLNIVGAAMDPAPTYCERQGYKVIMNETIDTSYCVFNEMEKCNLWEFYSGTCGQEFVKPLPCVKNGEPIFSGEICCDGLKYPPKSLLRGFIGQSTCQPTSKIVSFYLSDPSIWVILIVIILVIIWILRRKLRKSY